MASNRSQQGSAAGGHNGEATHPGEPRAVSRARAEYYSHDNIIARISATEIPGFVHQGIDARVGDVLLQELEVAMASDATPPAIAAPQGNPGQSASPLLVGVGSHVKGGK